jgi:hypothetical protein
MSNGTLPKGPFPFFNLSAELRIAVYDYLELPPVNNFSYGFIFSCRKAKKECEDVAVKKSKVWLKQYKRDVLPRCPYDVQIVMALPPSVAKQGRFNTLRNLTLVLPGTTDIVDKINWRDLEFYGSLRLFNPIFALWLDKLTIHFRDAEKNWMVKWYDCWDDEYFEETFPRLLRILDRGFVRGNNPERQEEKKGYHMCNLALDAWKPEPVHIREIVISWALEKYGGLTSDEVVEMEGTCTKDPTRMCTGPCEYAVKFYRTGEIARESTCRFRWPQHEQWGEWPVDKHKAKCWKCNGVWNCKRYMRGLPAKEERENTE